MSCFGRMFFLFEDILEMLRGLTCFMMFYLCFFFFFNGYWYILKNLFVLLLGVEDKFEVRNPNTMAVP